MFDNHNPDYDYQELYNPFNHNQIRIKYRKIELRKALLEIKTYWDKYSQFKFRDTREEIKKWQKEKRVYKYLDFWQLYAKHNLIFDYKKYDSNTPENRQAASDEFRRLKIESLEKKLQANTDNMVQLNTEWILKINGVIEPQWKKVLAEVEVATGISGKQIYLDYFASIVGRDWLRHNQSQFASTEKIVAWLAKEFALENSRHFDTLVSPYYHKTFVVPLFNALSQKHSTQQTSQMLAPLISSINNTLTTLVTNPNEFENLLARKEIVMENQNQNKQSQKQLLFNLNQETIHKLNKRLLRYNVESDKRPHYSPILDINLPMLTENVLSMDYHKRNQRLFWYALEWAFQHNGVTSNLDYDQRRQAAKNFIADLIKQNELGKAVDLKHLFLDIWQVQRQDGKRVIYGLRYNREKVAKIAGSDFGEYVNLMNAITEADFVRLFKQAVKDSPDYSETEKQVMTINAQKILPQFLDFALEYGKDRYQEISQLKTSGNDRETRGRYFQDLKYHSKKSLAIRDKSNFNQIFGYVELDPKIDLENFVRLDNEFEYLKDFFVGTIDKSVDPNLKLRFRRIDNLGENAFYDPEFNTMLLNINTKKGQRALFASLASYMDVNNFGTIDKPFSHSEAFAPFVSEYRQLYRKVKPNLNFASDKKHSLQNSSSKIFRDGFEWYLAWAGLNTSFNNSKAELKTQNDTAFDYMPREQKEKWFEFYENIFGFERQIANLCIPLEFADSQYLSWLDSIGQKVASKEVKLEQLDTWDAYNLLKHLQKNEKTLGNAENLNSQLEYYNTLVTKQNDNDKQNENHNENGNQR